MDKRKARELKALRSASKGVYPDNWYRRAKEAYAAQPHDRKDVAAALASTAVVTSPGRPRIRVRRRGIQ